MADKSFGVKELNLLNASGTPTVTSPNNLNLNANTVAISTSCTIGHNITVSANAGIASLNVTGIATVINFNATGISTIAQPADSNPMANWTITNNSASAYRFTGPGQSGTEDNPNIYLVRGHRYIFRHNATSSHPIQIRFANGGTAYTDGITYSEGNNTTTDGNNLIFNVQHDAPAQLFYQCTSHGGMVGNIYIVGGPQVISGVVTATTFVGNLTGTASANAVLTGSTNDQLVTVTGANAITGESALTYTNNILKNEVSDSSGLTAHILVNNSESSAGVSLLGSGSSFSSGGWAPVTDAAHIRSSAGAANGLVLQASAGDMRFYVDGSPTERLRISSSGQIGLSGANYGTSGQVLMSQGSGSAVQWASPAYIIHDVWALSSSMTTSSTETKVTSWTRANAYSATIGSAMTESSGIFTFPETGIYKVVFDVYYQTANSSRFISHRIYKVISATSTRIAQKLTSVNTAGSQWYQSDKVEAYFDVTNVSTHKIEFTVASENATTLGSGHSSSLIQTAAYFTKIGDT